MILQALTNSAIIRQVVMATAMTICLFPEVTAQQIRPEKPPLKIGFLIADRKNTAAKDGAELAILKANETAGPQGQRFKLAVRSMEGPWGAGADQAVELIFEEKVCALAGSHDGRNAHLVEQAATKSEVVFCSAWSGDPTLSQAFVPWFFNFAPNHNQQAGALVDIIFTKAKTTKLLVITDLEYDSESALKAFLNSIRETGKPVPESLKISGTEADWQAIRNSNPDAVLLFTGTRMALKIISLVRQNRKFPAFYAPVSVLNEDEIPVKDFRSFENVVFLSPEYWDHLKASPFREEFRKTYGYEPGMVAAYAYDAVLTLTQAIRRSGKGRENIQGALTGISVSGVSGDFRFDKTGNRTGTLAPYRIINGKPVRMKN